MTTRLPKPRSLEELEQMKRFLAQSENQLKEADRKADARRKIILGGAVIAMTKNNPALALTVLKAIDAFVPIARDRKDLEAYLPGGSVFEALVSGRKVGSAPLLKTGAPEVSVGPKPAGDPAPKTVGQTAPVEAKTFATPAEKTSPIGPGSEQKLSGLPVAKPVAERPVSGQKLFAPSVAKPVQGGPVSQEKSSEIPSAKPVGNPAVGGGNPGGLVPRNPAGTVGQSTGSLPIPRLQNRAGGERPAERPIPSGFLQYPKPAGEQPGEGGA